MKSAFFYSKKQHDLTRSRLTIDGLPYTEVIHFEDSETDIKPFGNWDDMVLVALVEGVTESIAGPMKILFHTGALEGRVAIGGRVFDYEFFLSLQRNI